MIELLILFELNKCVLTMYGISKEIKKLFAIFMTPSYGTIKPALVRLEKDGFIKSQKTMSKGGRPSIYYSITKNGRDELKELLLAEPLENPIQFLVNARVRLICANLLEIDEQRKLLEVLKTKATNVLYDTQNVLNTYELSYYPRMVLDNRVCEYKNFISMLEGVNHASHS